MHCSDSTSCTSVLGIQSRLTTLAREVIGPPDYRQTDNHCRLIIDCKAVAKQGDVLEGRQTRDRLLRPHALSPSLRKKVEPKRLHLGAVLENGATLEGGAVFYAP